MEPYSIILATHVLCGFLALGVGLIPMFSQKGSKIHVQTGRIYFWAMFGVFLTSSAMFFFKPDRLLFLFLVGIFSFHNTFTGARIVKYKKTSNTIDPLDWSVAVLVTIAGFSMIGLGIWSQFFGKFNLGVLYLVFGAICFANASFDLKDFYIRQYGEGRENKKAWLYKHITRMGGSYIATFTAFCVVNNTIFPGLVAWLAPGIVGSILIARSLRGVKVKNKTTIALRNKSVVERN